MLAVNEANKAYHNEVIKKEKKRIQEEKKQNELRKKINDGIEDITF